MRLLSFVIDDKGAFRCIAPIVGGWVALGDLQAVDIRVDRPALFYRLNNKTNAIEGLAATRDGGNYRNHERTPKNTSTDLIAARVKTALPMIDIA